MKKLFMWGGVALGALLVLGAIVISCNTPTPSPSGPVITLSVNHLDFFAVARGNNPPRQWIVVSNSGTDSLSITTSKSSSWLDLIEIPGNASDTIFASVFASSYAAGIYRDTILVASTSALNSPQKVAVSVTVVPAIQILPASIDFHALVNGPSVEPATLVLSSTGAVGLTYYTGVTQPWLHLSKTSGTTPDTVSVGLDHSALLSGDYVDSVVFNTSSSATPRIVVPVTLEMRSWASYALSTSNDLRGVCMINDSISFAVGFIGNTTGHSGVILKTENAGRTWDAKKYVDRTSLGGIFFTDPDHGWAVGDSSVLLFTNDGGDSWNQYPQASLPIADSLSLWRVSFADPAHGWIIGIKGVLLRTVNSGSTWTLESTPASFSLADLEIKSPTEGWIVGNHGTVMHTADGHQWDTQSSGTIRDLWAISMIDNMNGWIVGTGGFMLRTIDGGNTWVSQASGVTSELNDIIFIDQATGWAVGHDGIIVRYQPGTNSWSVQNSGVTRTLYNAAFSGSGRGIAVGELGTVLVTFNGGL